MRRMQPSDLRWERRLGRTARGETWMVRLPGGDTMVAKEVRGATQSQRTRLRAAVRKQRDVTCPMLTTFVESTSSDAAIWLLRPYVGGVPLGRFAALASPAAPQVAEILRGVLAALTGLHAAGLAHGSLTANNVFVEADGTVRIADAGIEPALRARANSWQQRDVAATEALATSIWRPSRRGRGQQLAELLESGRIGSAANADAAQEIVREALPVARNGTATDVGLAALASRLRGPAVAPAAGGTDDAAKAAATPAGRKFGDQPRHVDEARLALRAALAASGRRRRRSRLIVAALALVVLAAAGTFAGLRLTAKPAVRTGSQPPAGPQRASAPVHTVQAPPPAPAPTSTPGGAVLEPAAPAAAGFITGAQLAPLGSCQPGESCDVKTTFNLTGHDTQPITWEVVAVDRCTGTQTVLDSASVTALSAYATVWNTETITIPAGDPLLLYVVTQNPSRIASPPQPVTTSSTCGAPA